MNSGTVAATDVEIWVVRDMLGDPEGTVRIMCEWAAFGAVSDPVPVTATADQFIDILRWVELYGESIRTMSPTSPRLVL